VKRFVIAILILTSPSLYAQKTLDNGVSELASQITSSATKSDKQRIAVLPFHELDGQATILGTYLAEELVTKLFQLGNFKIVERQLLDKVMGELRIQRSGAIDPATAKEIGRIAAVDAIVTGSITELGSHVAVNCRLIDTTTGEVFGAAQTKVAKDEDVTKIMNLVVTPAGASSGQASHQALKGIATKDIASLRVTLKSVLPITSTNMIRWTFVLENREARRPIAVALNAVVPEDERGGGLRIVSASSSSSTPLRTSAIDDRGGSWTISSNGLRGIGFVRAGVHGRNGREAYSPIEIARLLRLRDELGRDTDDPSDGIMARATSMGEGGSNITFGGGRNTSPEQFFPYKGNRFISGATTVIAPGQSTTVTMDFRGNQGGSSSASESVVFQFSSEIVVGVGEPGSPNSYSLHNLTFDRVSLPAQ
jgi:curli biogenesis system outer membrane secretion channel CsgG